MDDPEISDVAQGALDLGWEAPPRRSGAENAAPTLSAEGFEGPLDWLLEMVRAQKIDLSRLPLLALIESFAEALDRALRQAGVTANKLGQWGGWTVMAADLTLLRSRLVAPADTADADDAREQAEVLRRQMVGRAEIGATADWLEQREQLGRDVFGRGRLPGTAQVGGGRIGDITSLLRACLVALRLPADSAERYRLPAPPFWTVADAIERIRTLLPKLGDDGGELEAFLPELPIGMPDRERRCRIAVASSLVGALEIARTGTALLDQIEAWRPIRIASPRPDQGHCRTVGSSRTPDPAVPSDA